MMLPLGSRVLDHPSLRFRSNRTAQHAGNGGHLVDAGHWIHERAVV
jgi:hypothetical protein